MAKRIQLSKVAYLGEHPSYPKPKDPMIVVVDDDGVHLRGMTEKFVVPWAEVTAVAIDGPDQASKRVTAARLVGLGVFAFAAKKNTTETYLQVDTAAYAVSFMVPKVAAGQLRAQMAPWIHQIPEPPATEAAASSTATELTQLAELRDRGVLSEDEFAAEKARLLGR